MAVVSLREKALKLDQDIKEMSLGGLRSELQRVRKLIRVHRDAKGNARCWLNDLLLYEKSLPEQKPAGKMDLPEKVLLRECKRYIRRQQCPHAMKCEKKS